MRRLLQWLYYPAVMAGAITLAWAVHRAGAPLGLSAYLAVAASGLTVFLGETLIPYRNALALVSYYLGVFALIPCAGLVLGPGALVLGIMGLSYRKKNPTAGGTAHAIVGIVLGSLVLLAHLALVVWVVVLANMK